MKAVLGCALLALFAGALCAQATAATSGSVNAGYTIVQRVQVDFGSTAKSLVIDMTATTASAQGIDVELLDVEAQVAMSPSSAYITLASAGSSNVLLSAGPYSGMADFYVTVTTFGGGAADYAVGLSCMGAADMQVVGSKVSINGNASQIFTELPTRAFYHYGEFQNGGNVSREFKVDFGSTPQSIQFVLDYSSFWGLDGLAVFEKTGSSVETQIYTSGGFAGGGLVGITTGSHTGVVTFRVQMTVNAWGDDVEWTATVPRSVTTAGTNGGSSSGGGGGGKLSPSSSSGGGGGGCAAAHSGIVVPSLALLGLLVMSLRRRRA
jgi:hypothetical protein